MKHLDNYLILSDGSAVFIKRPNLKVLSNSTINKNDYNNHFIWSKANSNYIDQTEISTFVHKFNNNANKIFYKQIP